MRTIYIDSDFKCHTINDNMFTAVETNFFDGKCDTFIEGFRFIPNGKIWKHKDGTIFSGEMVASWKPYTELVAIQIEYERNQKLIAELDAALLESTYNNLTGGV